MEGFVDIRNNPFAGRAVWLIYGAPKVGKTTLVLEMIKQHKDQKVILLSADVGDGAVRIDPEPYDGQLKVAYPDTIREWRSIVHATQDIVAKIGPKVGAKNLWVVVDTVTSLQNKIMTESRKIASKKEMRNPKSASSAPSASSTRVVEDAEYVRDILTQVDYGVNACLMGEITNALMVLPANIVFIALEAYKKDQYDRDVAKPQLSGQTEGKLGGDADVIARMINDQEGRKLLIHNEGSWVSGDRFNRLDPIEKAPDLYQLRNKIFAAKTAT